MQILIIAMLSKEVEDEVKKISLKYQPMLYLGKELPPHLTLVPPADLIGKFFELEESLEKSLRGQTGIKMAISEIGFFSKRNCVVYLQVERTEQLEDLHQKLIRLISSFVEPNSLKKSPFSPHITLAKKLDHNQLDQILQELKDYQPIFNFPLKEIGLFVLDEQERIWHLARKFKLKLII